MTNETQDKETEVKDLSGRTLSEIHNSFETDRKRLRNRIIINPYWAFRRFLSIIIDIPYNIRMFYQRGRRGWSDSDAWNADYHLAEVISGICLELKRIAHGHPSDLTQESWNKILLEIADGFTAIEEMDELDNPDWDNPVSRKAWDEEIACLEAKQANGLKLFAKYFNNLLD